MLVRYHANSLRRVALLTALMLCPAVLLPQRSVRIRWPLIDWVVRGDTGRPLMLVVSTNLLGRRDSSARGGPDWVLFDAREALQWTASLRPRLDSPLSNGGSPAAPLGPTLWSVAGDRLLAVSVDPTTTESDRLLVLMTDTTGKKGYRVGASLRDLRALLDGLESISAWVVNPDRAPPPPREGESPSCPAEAQYLNQLPLDVDPKHLSGPPMTYPEGERYAGISGRVLVEVLIDSLGRPDPSGSCVVLTDGAGFTKSALAYVRQSRFKPGVRGGRPVAALVIMPIEYRLRSRR